MWWAIPITIILAILGLCGYLGGPEVTARAADRAGLTSFTTTTLVIAVLAWLVIRVILWVRYMRAGQ